MNGKSKSTKAGAIRRYCTKCGIANIHKILYLCRGLLERFFHVSVPGLTILVPLGIAFYTLQAIGYCVDIYRRKYAAQKSS